MYLETQLCHVAYLVYQNRTIYFILPIQIIFKGTPIWESLYFRKIAKILRCNIAEDIAQLQKCMPRKHKSWVQFLIKKSCKMQWRLIFWYRFIIAHISIHWPAIVEITKIWQSQYLNEFVRALVTTALTNQGHLFPTTLDVLVSEVSN